MLQSLHFQAGMDQPSQDRDPLESTRSRKRDDETPDWGADLLGGVTDADGRHGETGEGTGGDRTGNGSGDENADADFLGPLLKAMGIGVDGEGNAVRLHLDAVTHTAVSGSLDRGDEGALQSRNESAEVRVEAALSSAFDLSGPLFSGATRTASGRPQEGTNERAASRLGSSSSDEGVDEERLVVGSGGHLRPSRR